jgi:hypothetical protein
LDVFFSTILKLYKTYLQKPILDSQNISITMWFPMNLATSCLMMPHFFFNDLANLGAQPMGCNSLK